MLLSFLCKTKKSYPIFFRYFPSRVYKTNRSLSVFQSNNEDMKLPLLRLAFKFWFATSNPRIEIPRNKILAKISKNESSSLSFPAVLKNCLRYFNLVTRTEHNDTLRCTLKILIQTDGVISEHDLFRLVQQNTSFEEEHTKKHECEHWRTLLLITLCNCCNCAREVEQHEFLDESDDVMMIVLWRHQNHTNF